MKRLKLRETEGKVAQSCQTLRHYGLYSPWNSPGQNTGVGCPSLLQRTFPTQGSNPGLTHCRRIFYHPSHQGSPLGMRCILIKTGILWHRKWSYLWNPMKQNYYTINFICARSGFYCLIWQVIRNSSFSLIIFYVDHFKNLYWICYNIASVLCFGFLALRHVGRILAPWPGIKPASLSLKGKVLTTGLPEKSPLVILEWCPETAGRF